MSTGAVIAIVVAVILIVVIAAIAIPRARERRDIARLQAEHRERADSEQERADAQQRRAQIAEAEAQRAAADAQIAEARAAEHRSVAEADPADLRRRDDLPAVDERAAG